jgi:hypothetical protein
MVVFKRALKLAFKIKSSTSVGIKKEAKLAFPQELRL